MFKIKSIGLGIVLATVFLTPLLFVSNTNELYEFPKTLLVWAAGALLFGLLLIRAVWDFDSVKNLRLAKLDYFVLVFLLVNFLASILSMHIQTSVFGYYTRFNDSLLTTAIFTLFYFIVRIFGRGIGNFKELFFNILTFSSIPVGVVACMQYFRGVERAFSTLGQSNWLAAYAVMVFFVTFSLFLKHRGWFRLILFFTLILNYLSLWFSFSLSGFLAFGSVFLALLFFEWHRLKDHFQILILYFLICFVLSVSSAGLFVRKIEGVLQDLRKTSGTIVYAQSAEESLTGQVSDPAFIRLNLWGDTVNLIFSSPKTFLVGTGPETFPYVFYPFRGLDLNYSSEWDYIFNKPHNYYLEVWAETGLVGLVSYLALVWAFLRKAPFPIKYSFAGFLITNIFGWPVSSTALIFYLFLAVVANENSSN